MKILMHHDRICIYNSKLDEKGLIQTHVDNIQTYFQFMLIITLMNIWALHYQ
jgi:hypothetical protein